MGNSLVSRTEPRPAQSSRPTQASVSPASVSSVSAGVSRAQSNVIAAQKRPGVILGNTNELGKQRFRMMLYGPTGARKTVTAAQFGDTQEVRIIVTRKKEQLRPLEDMGYQYALVERADDLEAVITHPEAFWTDPTWVKNPDRTLIIDDITEGVNIAVDDAGVIDGKQVKDPRRSYGQAGKDSRGWIKLAWKAEQHVILVALEKIKADAMGERVAPDLPPSMLSMYTTDLDYVFYIKTGLWRLVVDRKQETFKKVVDGKEDDLQRFIFAKNKLPLIYKDRQILGLDEPMDLRQIWNKILNAKNAKPKAATANPTRR